MLRILPDQPDYQPSDTTKETDMPDQQHPPADHDNQLQSDPGPVDAASAVLDDLERHLGQPVSPLIRQVVADAAANPPATLAEAVRTPDIQPALDKVVPSPWELAAREFNERADD